ncbi:MAG: hypothetical protein DLM73_15870 [Chthoniobacterales bacterium]|nr:MAG: hypothetical protein DLM73_15870 [Chthoniobacterales bacterium]
MTRTKAKNIDDYLATLPENQRAALEKLRKAIKAAAPKAEECISYDMPAFRLDGKLLVSFAAWAKHCAFYPGSYPAKVHQAALKAYDTNKGSIRFSEENPLPATLVRKLVKSRVAQREK